MSGDAVSEIRDKLDIIDLVSARVTLKKTGRNWKGLCPFHQEKTASFVVFPDSQNFHCFGCGRSGDIFTYYQLSEKVDFREALAELADRAGVELEYSQRAIPTHDPASDRSAELVSIAAALYTTVLQQTAAGQSARRYLTDRGLTGEVIDQFQLGFAPDSWDYLLRQFSAKGIYAQDAVDAGLLQTRETGGYYDRFRNRLMFPIRNREGLVVGFGARSMGDDQPKYLNSPQSAVFDKSRLLYGLDLATEAIRQTDQVVVVEGYMDVIAAHQFNHRNVVATMGTAVTDDQIGLVKRLTRRIVLALDADAAGQSAAIRAVEAVQGGLVQSEQFLVDPGRAFRIATNLESELFVAELPADTDPDSLIRTSPAQWESVIADARPYAEYLIEKITEDVPRDDAMAKRRAVDRLAPVLKLIPDEIVRSHYAQMLGRKLGLGFGDVQKRIQGANISRRRRSDDTGESRQGTPTLLVEDHLMALLLRHRPLAFDLIKEVPPDDLTDVRNRMLLTLLKDPDIDDSRNGPELLKDIEPHLASHGDMLLGSLEDRPSQKPGEVREEILQTLVRLERDRYEVLSAHLRSEIEQAETSEDPETQESLSGYLERLAVMHRRLYPRPSPYFPDSRTKDPIKQKRSFV